MQVHLDFLRRNRQENLSAHRSVHPKVDRYVEDRVTFRQAIRSDGRTIIGICVCTSSERGNREAAGAQGAGGIRLDQAASNSEAW